MESCTSHCTLGFTWWQVTIIVAAAFLCYALMELGHRAFDLYEDRHRNEPIEPADDTPLNPPEDRLSFQEWAAEPKDPVWVAPPQPPRVDLPERDEHGDTIVDAEVVVEEDNAPLLERPAFAELDDKAKYWFVRSTLHKTSCGVVTRVRKQDNWPDVAAPVPTNDEEVVRRLVAIRQLTLCGRCNPL